MRSLGLPFMSFSTTSFLKFGTCMHANGAGHETDLTTTINPSSWRELPLIRKMTDRIRFEVAAAKESSGSDYDFVFVFDCLHAMSDPVGAANHVRRAIKNDGPWMIVEPFANDDLDDNLNPVGRVYFSFSTLLRISFGERSSTVSSNVFRCGPQLVRQEVNRER
jgi:hypothetical protein